jgi:predicted kinase
VSYDDAREELGLRHGKNEGRVSDLAIDKAKDLLRAKKSFIWNATHLGPLSRQKTLDLLFAYNAQVEVVYLERPRAALLARNSKRDTSLNNKMLQAMLLKWEPPLPTEAHAVRYLVD